MEEGDPKMQREVFVHAAKSSNEMIFESSNGALSSTAAMNSRRNKLEVDFFFVHEGFEHGGAFIVEALQFRTEASGAQFGMNDFARIKNGGCMPGLHRFG